MKRLGTGGLESPESRESYYREVLKQDVEQPLRFAETAAQMPRYLMTGLLPKAPRSATERLQLLEQGAYEELQYAKALRSTMKAVVHNRVVEKVIPVLSYGEQAWEAAGQAAAKQYDKAAVTVLNASIEVPFVNLSAGATGVASAAAIAGGCALAGISYPAFVGIVGGGYLAVHAAEEAQHLYDACLEPTVKHLATSAVEVVERAFAPRGLTSEQLAEYEQRRLRDIEANRQAALLDAFPAARGATFTDPREVVLRTPPTGNAELPGEISDNCTIQTTGWWIDEPAKKWSATWHVRDGKITRPGPNFTFRGTLNGNAITGGWEYDDGGGVNEKLVFHPNGRLSWDADIYGPDAMGMMRRVARKGGGNWRIIAPAVDEEWTPSEPPSRMRER